MCLPPVRHEKGTQTQTFESGYFPVGEGSSMWMGGGQKARYVPRNQGNKTFLAAYPGILLGYPGGARKVRETKKFVFDFWPLSGGCPWGPSGLALRNPRSFKNLKCPEHFKLDTPECQAWRAPRTPPGWQSIAHPDLRGHSIRHSRWHSGPSVGCTAKGAYGNTAFWEGFWEGSGKGSGEGLRKGSEKGVFYGFYSKKGFWEGFSEGVLRRGFPEGA